MKKMKEKMERLYKFNNKNIEINLFNVKYYMYTYENNYINLIIYMRTNSSIEIDLSEKEFNNFEDSIKSLFKTKK